MHDKNLAPSIPKGFAWETVGKWLNLSQIGWLNKNGERHTLCMVHRLDAYLSL